MVDVAEWFRRNTVDVVYARSNRVVHPKTGSSAVGSAPRSGRGGRAFESPLPDKCSVSIVVIILACHAGDEDSISSCCSKTLPFSIKAIIQDSGSWDTCSIRVTATMESKTGRVR